MRWVRGDLLQEAAAEIERLQQLLALYTVNLPEPVGPDIPELD